MGYSLNSIIQMFANADYKAYTEGLTPHGDMEMALRFRYGRDCLACDAINTCK